MRIFIIILFTILYPYNLEIQPSAYIEYYTNGGEFSLESDPITFMGWSINTNYENNNFNIETSFSAHGINGYTPKYNDLNQRQGIPYLVNYMDNYQDLGIYWTSMANVSYQKEKILFEIGNPSRNWGSGLNSIFISHKAPNYPSFGIKWDITPNIHFSYFYAFLNQSSNLIDEIGIYSYKSMASHSVIYQFTDKLFISLYETVIFDRYMDINYLNPFVLYYPLSRYMGYNDNNQIGIEFNYLPKKNKKFYFSLMIDEWDPDLTFEKYHENWFAYQIGAQLKNVIFETDLINFEYSWTDYRVYENKYETVNFYLEGYPLGYWAGSHARTYLFNYKILLSKFNIEMSYLNVKKGISPIDLIDIAYNKIEFDRYSNGFEQKGIYKFNIRYNLGNSLSIENIINFIQWSDENEKIDSIDRFYFGINIIYIGSRLNL